MAPPEETTTTLVSALDHLDRSKADRLNRDCFCVTLDWDRLCKSLRREAGDPDFCQRLIGTRPHLFSSAPLFLPRAALDDMLAIVRAIEGNA